jgi:hypothetical protein
VTKHRLGITAAPGEIGDSSPSAGPRLEEEQQKSDDSTVNSGMPGTSPTDDKSPVTREERQ